MNPQEHEVWLTVYNTALAHENARIEKYGCTATRAVSRLYAIAPPNYAADTANAALAAYRKACASPATDTERNT